MSNNIVAKTTKNMRKMKKELSVAMKKGRKAFGKKRNLKKLGKELKDKVKADMLKGTGTNEAGKAQRYRPLMESTKETRRSLRRNGRLSQDTSPSKSNQISSGTMYDKLILQVTTNKIIIRPTKSRVDVAEYQEEMGNETFNVRNKYRKEIEEKLSKLVEKEFQKLVK